MRGSGRRSSFRVTKDDEELQRIRSASHEAAVAESAARVEEVAKDMERRLLEIQNYGEAEIESLVRTRYEQICEVRDEKARSELITMKTNMQCEETSLRQELEIQKQHAQEELSIATRRVREIRDEFESAEKRALKLRSELSEYELQNAMTSLHAGSAENETKHERERAKEYIAEARRAIEQQVQGCAAELVESDAQLERAREEMLTMERDLKIESERCENKLKERLERALTERDEARREMKRAADIMSQEHEEVLEGVRRREIERRKEFQESSTLNQQHMESQIMSVQRLENQYREIEMIAFQETSSLQDRISELRDRNEALALISSSNEHNAVRSIEAEMLRKDSEHRNTMRNEETVLLEIQCRHREEQKAKDRVMTLLREEILNARAEVSTVSTENSCLDENVSNALTRLGQVDARSRHFKEHRLRKI
eukprot:g3542.t1